MVFFCGAGVSRAKAGLGDFIGLARDVADKLLIPRGNPARQLIDAIANTPAIAGVGSLISADRVFSLIERDYVSEDIYRAIAESLKPAGTPDLSAHRVLLDLAKGPDGTVRLITTNFDLLFEECDPAIPVSRQPRLPDPLRAEFQGIVHLHGHVTQDYDGAAGEGLIISSGEFGRAYLSERWAVDFIKTVLERFVVVFVGYSADDPPMQYLLEALNRSAGSYSGAYALQSGSYEDAEARWIQKGVKPITYEVGQHSILWDSLALWSERARNPADWHSALFAQALKGPEACEPHVRGQVAHAASTLYGTKLIAESSPALPSEWLCTFDSHVRFAAPGRVGSIMEPGEHFDPFAAYGLDSDPVPARADPESSTFEKFETPSSAWNAFQLTRADQQDLKEDQVATLRGHWSLHSPRLAPRIAHLGRWLQKVSQEPAAMWWAARQYGIHPDIQHQIEYGLEGSNKSTPLTRRAWRYLIDSWRTARHDVSNEYYHLLEMVKADGWTAEAVRSFGQIHRPRIVAKAPFSGSPRPPTEPLKGLHDLMHLDVKYPHHTEEHSLPESILPYFVEQLRLNLQLGAALEEELGGYGLGQLDAIEPDNDEDPTDREFKHGINVPLFQYVKVLRHLANTLPKAARSELNTWCDLRGSISAHIKIWACNDFRLVSKADIPRVLRSLSRHEFWESSHQRDLLLALVARWQQMRGSTRRSIERRLLQGRKRWKREPLDEFKKRRASAILSRIHYLHSKGCEFSFDLDDETKKLRTALPDWKPEYAAQAAISMGMRTGWVATDTSNDELLHAPLSELLEAATKLSGRSNTRLFVTRDPFAGLCGSMPVRAFAALRLATKKGEYSEQYWTAFLNHENIRKTDRIRFTTIVAAQLLRLPDDFVARMVRPISDWLLRIYQALLPLHRDILDALWIRVVGLIRSHEIIATRVVLNQQPDWATEALNSTVGYLAQILLHDPAINGLKGGEQLPNWWKDRADELLSLPGNHRRHALAILCHNLAWLFSVDPDWVSKSILPTAEQQDEDGDAFWAGFFWAARVPQYPLFVLMKPALLRLAHKVSETRRKHTEILSGMILAGWGKGRDGSRIIGDAELTEILLEADDDFRTRLLWHLETWAKADASRWHEDAIRLLTYVWPRQIAAKTPRVSAKLAELAFAQGQRFPEFVNCVLPLVVPVDQDYINLPFERRDKEQIVEKYPERTLALLSAVLSDNIRQWPYGVSDLLDRIAKADPKLLTDLRLIKLNRIRTAF